MTIRLPLFNHIKALFVGFTSDKGVRQTTVQSCEADVPPARAESSESPAPGVDAVKRQNQVRAPLVSGKSTQFWSTNLDRGRQVVQTPSNLG